MDLRRMSHVFEIRVCILNVVVLLHLRHSTPCLQSYWDRIFKPEAWIFDIRLERSSASSHCNLFPCRRRVVCNV
ncbi:hypothetical protein C8R43DRAFT_1007629 [Mycena crocata]|nr:hypothetical protein C8R43DRAFT_1007629 [Mycena crocata]